MFCCVDIVSNITALFEYRKIRVLQIPFLVIVVKHILILDE